MCEFQNKEPRLSLTYAAVLSMFTVMSVLLYCVGRIYWYMKPGYLCLGVWGLQQEQLVILFLQNFLNDSCDKIKGYN